MKDRVYLCIDLKSYYASVECLDRGLDPFCTNLVVADPDRGKGAVCLAVSPAMKALGVPGRCRIFEIPAGIEYITAKPRMRLYLEKSTEICGIYRKYVSAEDIHIYSVDECFVDMTDYIKIYHTGAKEFAVKLMNAVMKGTGICSSAGVGTNMFLAKVALDICAKSAKDHIGYLDEAAYREKIWHHRPITDIWNVGAGTARRLREMGVYDMYGVSRLPPDILYREFGINAQYLIDHSAGTENCTISRIKDYVPRSHSLSNTQVLFSDYSYEDARLVMHEMADMLVLDLIRGRMTTDSVTLYMGYSKEELGYSGGSARLDCRTSSAKKIIKALDSVCFAHVAREKPIRRIGICFEGLEDESERQLTVFDDTYGDEKEYALLQTVAAIHDKYGKNMLLKGRDFEKAATLRARNGMIGGHNA